MDTDPGIAQSRDKALLRLGWLVDYPSEFIDGYLEYYNTDKRYRGLAYVQAFGIRVYYD